MEEMNKTKLRKLRRAAGVCIDCGLLPPAMVYGQPGVRCKACNELRREKEAKRKAGPAITGVDRVECINRRARDLGMSYGYYKALVYNKREGETFEELWEKYGGSKYDERNKP